MPCATWGYPNVSLHREQQARLFFFRHLNTITSTKASDTHPYHIFPGSDIILKPILIILSVNIQNLLLSSFICLYSRWVQICCAVQVLTHSNVTVKCSTYAENKYSTLLDACMGKHSGTLMMLVNNISHNSGFRWKVLIRLHLPSSGPPASQLLWPTFLAITDVLAK